MGKYSDKVVGEGMPMVFKKLRERGIGFEAGSETFSENRPTLVMIHGAGGCSRVWQGQIRPLGRTLNTLALDLPGHGKTPGPGKADIREYTDWLADLLDAAFSHPVFLMGHSMGGAIALELALSSITSLKGIILASSGARLGVAPEFLTGLLNNFEEMVDSIMHYAYAPDADESLVREGARLMKEAGSKTAHDDFLACDRFDRRKDLGNIQIPCLIVCGEQDILTPKTLSRSLHENIQGSSLHFFPSAGHMVMIESHGAFNQCIKDFVLREEG